MTDGIHPPTHRRACALQRKNSVSSVTSYIDPDAGAPSGTAWTPARVEERLREAVALRTVLAGERPVDEIASRRDAEGAGNIGGIIGGIDVTGPVAAGDASVAEAVEALSWLGWLDGNDAALVVARLEGAPWKVICWRSGISRPTADRRWRYALALIAWHANGHAQSAPTPSLRSLLGLRRAA